jgi:1,4-alpha-glucan branching enzyme
MKKGRLALLLHAHLPFVRHPEHGDFLEEDWLFEAIAETYVPLLMRFERLAEEGVPFRLTMSISPPLAAMLEDELLQARAVRYLQRALTLAENEVARSRGEERIRAVAAFYHARFREVLAYFEAKKRRLIPVFRALQDAGFLEIATCAATHGFLPLLAVHPPAVRAQILVARDEHTRWFGRLPAGIWLPECAYFPGLENFLHEAGLRWFVVDAHGLMLGRPRPQNGIYAPCWTPGGPAVFARDPDSARRVWSREDGYPGDPAYRDFYRDIGYDLPLPYVQPFLGKDGQRKFTGLKYHRITGATEQKELYHRPWAEAAAAAHAEDFMRSRAAQFGPLGEALPVDPVLLCPYDAELFGHWWFEGPEFLEAFLRLAATGQEVFTLTTPSEYLAGQAALQVVEPSASSWGDEGYWSVWLDPSNTWIYPPLHEAARRMTQAAQKHRQTRAAWKLSTLQQMARELMLAQSSDWAFLMRSGTAKEYATARTNAHLERFRRLASTLERGRPDKDFLATCRERDNIFPDLAWRYYL